VCVCVCVCLGVGVCVCVCVSACMRACTHARTRACLFLFAKLTFMRLLLLVQQHLPLLDIIIIIVTIVINLFGIITILFTSPLPAAHSS
jgi:hypothetical protein